MGSRIGKDQQRKPPRKFSKPILAHFLIVCGSLWKLAFSFLGELFSCLVSSNYYYDDDVQAD